MARTQNLGLLVPLALVASLSACSGSRNDPSLSKKGPELDLSTVPVPAADGPRLAAIVPVVPIMERPKNDARQLGELRGGALIPRAKEPISKDGCPGGWYPVRPKGFVCVGPSATIDLSHPALKTFAVRPKLDAPLPYDYARTGSAITVYEWIRGKGAMVREAGKMRKGSGVAIVGAWDAITPKGDMAHLGLLSDGRFVAASDVKPAELPAFKGMELGENARPPLAFVVKQGVRTWKVEKQTADKKGHLEPMSVLKLTGKFRQIADEKFWATDDGRYVRHKDVTLIAKRDHFPDIANAPDQKWIDIGVVMGTLVAYEGKKPVYATLISTGRDRLGDPKSTASTQLGTFPISAKYISSSRPGTKPFSDEFDLQDVPWVMELGSGQSLLGSWWHARYGVEYGSGNVHVPPVDAAWLFKWAGPEIPEGWHGASTPDSDKKTLVVIRK